MSEGQQKKRCCCLVPNSEKKLQNPPGSICLPQNYPKKTLKSSTITVVCSCGNKLTITLALDFIPNTVQTFENGLRNDNEFYSEHTNDFVVAKKGKLKLPSNDYMTLNSNMWLSNFLMEFLCFLFVPSSIQVEILNSRHIVEKIGEKCIEFHKNVVLLPLVECDHWVLFIINIEKKTFSYLNSLRNSGGYFGQDFYGNFIRYIKLYNKKFEKKLPRKSEWKEISYSIDYQTDSNNCGIHVWMYIMQFIEEGKVTQRVINVDQTRRQLQYDCLKLSDDMKNACLTCGDELENGEPKFNANIVNV